MKYLSVLGSTGSVGMQTLHVIRNHRDKLAVKALAVNRNIEILYKQIQEFKPEIVAVYDKESAFRLKDSISSNVKIVYGMDGLCEVAAYHASDMVMSAISGSIGLLPTYTSIENAKNIALANKETMVVAGDIINKKANEKNVRIIPVDSEHSAIFQCLYGNEKKDLHKILLTASGGPFLGKTKEELNNVTVENALKHPNWTMGSKISIDSATLMNKGLEVIEAAMLFDVDYKKIEVVVHPQSIVHSMVEYIDGSIIAQLGITDMKIPIHIALFYPQRIESACEKLSLFDKTLTFYKPDLETFYSLSLAYEAAKIGHTMPLVLNAANEIAVYAFLKKEIKFVHIPKIVSEMMDAHDPIGNLSLQEILELDKAIKRQTKEYIDKKYLI
jgi:1-deoxy-D-xylulose-5-phosphate reductoisomerase